MKTTSSNRLFQIVISCLTLTLLLWCGNARAQITLQDGTLQPAVTATSPVSMDFTSTVGANSVLVVSVFSRDNQASDTLPATLPWGTQNLTKAVSVNGAASTWAWCDIYYLFNPNAETHTISVSDTLNASPSGMDLQVYTLTGVDPNVLPITYKTNFNGTTNLTLTLPASMGPGLAVVNSSYGTANLIMNVMATVGTVNCWETNNAISADMGYVNGIPATGSTITSWAGPGAATQKMGLAIAFFTQLGAGPAAPGNFTATPTAHEVDLSWNPSAGATSYNVWRAQAGGGFTEIATGITGTMYPDTAVSPYTQYYYYVQGVNGSGGGGFSLEAGAFPEWATGVIGLLDGSLTGGQVDWYTNNNTVVGQSISNTLTVSTGASVLIVNVFDQITNANKNISSDWTPATLSWGSQTLTKAIGQFLGEGSRPGLTEACDTYYLFNPTPGQQTVTFTDTSGDPVWCQDMQSYTLHDVDTTVAPVTYGNGTGYANYGTTNTLSSGTPSGAFATICDASAATSPLPFVKSSSGTTNYATSPIHNPGVPAFEHQTVVMGGVLGLAAGTGMIWDDNGTSGGVPAMLANAVFTAYIPPSAPTPPTNVTATGQTNQILVSWNSSASATAYVVLRSSTSGSGYLPIGTNNDVANTNYTDVQVATYANYYYVVKARNSNGDSALSSPEAGASAVGVPATPTGLGATWGDSVANLTWNASGGATGYSLLRSTTSGSGFTNLAVNLASTSYTDTTVVDFTVYYYEVNASNSFGTSANSAQVSASPGPVLTNYIGIFNVPADVANWDLPGGSAGGTGSFYADAPTNGPSTGCMLYQLSISNGGAWGGVENHSFAHYNETNATALEFDIKNEGPWDLANEIGQLQPILISDADSYMQWGGPNPGLTIASADTNNGWVHVVMPISANDGGSPVNWFGITGLNLNIYEGDWYATPTTMMIGYANIKFTGAIGHQAFFSGLSSPSIAAGTPSVTLTGTVSGGNGNYLFLGTSISVTINGNTQNTTIDDATGDFSIAYNTTGLGMGVYPVTYNSASDNQIFVAGSDSSTSLTVTSAAPPPTINPVTLDPTGQNLQISVATSLGHTYYLLSATNLNPPVIWSTNTTTAGTGGTITNLVPINLSKDLFLQYQVQ